MAEIKTKTKTNTKIEHHPHCRADYPEKPAGESPQQTVEIDLGDGMIVLQCVDCGEFVVVTKTQSNKGEQLL